MEIKTLTTFDVYNYGASLQAYALMTFLHKNGHNVEIIDYQPEYLTRKYNYKWVNPESSLSKTAVTRGIYRFMKYFQRQFTLKRKKAFDDFHNKYLIRTSKKYTSPQEIKENPPEADAFIVGSDQVWNVFYETGRDDTFFLDFVNNGRKISYAASFSFIDLDSIQLERVRNLLISFNAIGVREWQGVRLLDKIHINSTWTLDPVFLLSRKDWETLIIPFNNTEPYVLVYDFEGSQDLKQFALDYAKERNLKIYSITDTYPKIYADRNFNSAGPMEFLSLIMGCDAFISNSFHGTAFSIIFNKPVFVFSRKRHRVNSRMESLMSLFDLKQNLYSEYSPSLVKNIKDIDFLKINSIMESERAKSINFLTTNL